MTRRLAAAGIAAALSLTGAFVSGREMVEIHLRGFYFTEPAVVQAVIEVEPDPQNRVLRIEADGDNMFRSSEVELAGSGDKRLHTIQFKNLAAGNYTLRAEVLSSSSVLAMAEQELVVASR